MKKLISCLSAVSLVALFTGCAVVSPPVQGGSVGGWIYSDYSAPQFVTTNAGGSKVGSATAKSILAIVGTGDASIQAACKAGGITKISHVDYHVMSILGLYGEYTVTVYGE